MTAFALRGVTVEFDGGRGLEGLDLQAESGEVIALLGSSGAGKSTLLRVLAGLQPITDGEVRVRDTNTTELWGADLRRLRADVGLMMQHDNLVEGLRVFHNVAMGRLGRWSALRSLATLVWPRRSDVHAVADALSQVELRDRLWAWPQHLSGGERQRVALARLLLQAPHLWLADEPAAGLDPRLRRQLLTHLIALVRGQGATLIVSLHDVDLVDDAFDRVVGLARGRVAFDSTPANLTKNQLAKLYAA